MSYTSQWFRSRKPSISETLVGVLKRVERPSKARIRRAYLSAVVSLHLRRRSHAHPLSRTIYQPASLTDCDAAAAAAAIAAAQINERNSSATIVSKQRSAILTRILLWINYVPTTVAD